MLTGKYSTGAEYALTTPITAKGVRGESSVRIVREEYWREVRSVNIRVEEEGEET